VFDRIGRVDDAIRCFKEAIRLAPQWMRPRILMGIALVRRGSAAKAVDNYRNARRIDPSDALLHSALLGALHYLPQVEPAALFEEHRAWDREHAARFAPDRFAAAEPRAMASDPAADRPLRIGYVSGDFCDHPAGSFIAPILASHDRRSFLIVCYFTKPFGDAITDRFRAGADLWRDAAALSDDQLAQQIRLDKIDILIDLSGHTGRNRLLVFARKPAPVQVTYLGYCDTTGLSTMDYRVTDAVADPPGQEAFYTEKLLRLPSGFSCFALAPTAPPVQSRPNSGPVTFGSLNGLAKLNESVIHLWCDVLRAAPDSRLLICRHELRGVAAERLRHWFRAREIPDERVELRGDFDGPRYLALYDDIDIALDVQPWSGHTTACEALWMGVPVVTMTGRTQAGRMVASVLTHAGLGELIAADRDQYISVAAELASDRGRLATLRSQMRDRLLGSPVMNGGGDVTRDLENAYRRIWAAYLTQVR
jgi:predicted O-linked N-acetylglucosamine transferase (SPINDLY family)